MKGLFIKDLALMKQRSKILIFLVIWSIVMSFAMEDASFSVGWVVMIGALISISTIAYDEYDNGMPFLMSLPVSRAGYAIEKYLFVILWSAAFWAMSVIIAFVSGLISGRALTAGGDLPGMLLSLAILLVVVSFSIPPQLKWGPERGKVVMLILFAVVFAAVISLRRSGDGAQRLAARLEGMPMPLFVPAAFLAGLAMTAVSLFISIRIMKGREF